MKESELQVLRQRKENGDGEKLIISSEKLILYFQITEIFY